MSGVVRAFSRGAKSMGKVFGSSSRAEKTARQHLTRHSAKGVRNAAYNAAMRGMLRGIGPGTGAAALGVDGAGPGAGLGVPLVYTQQYPTYCTCKQRKAREVTDHEGNRVTIYKCSGCAPKGMGLADYARELEGLPKGFQPLGRRRTRVPGEYAALASGRLSAVAEENSAAAGSRLQGGRRTRKVRFRTRATRRRSS